MKQCQKRLLEHKQKTNTNTLCLMTPNPQVHKVGRMCLSEMAQKKTPIISFWFLKKHYCLCGEVWTTCQNCKLNHKMDGDYLNNGRLPASRDILRIVLPLFANYGGPPVGVREDGAPHHPTQLLGANPSPQITTPYNPWHTTSSIQQPPHTTPGWATTQPQLHHSK